MMDLDHFKQVNDTWGHAAGDTVLRQTGQLLPTLLRSVDVLGRVGGEEFVIVLPQTSADAARQVLERCRSALETTPVVLEDGRQLSVTASFGLCHAHATNHTTLQQLLESADLALYRAKHAGRNRVESASLS
jgi:diguanylate cyclase (GGDEF)-like protein